MNHDQAVQRSVQSELEYEPRLNPADIRVTVAGGRVTLSGSVGTFAEQLAAVRTSERLVGVEDVTDDLLVKLTAAHQRTDAQLVQAAHEAFWVLPHQGVSVQAEDGWITLGGTVAWAFQRDSANDAVAHLIGVRGIHNLIALTPHPQPGEIECSIRGAFERRSELDAALVTVEVVGGQVTLRGHLSTRAEREEATRAAWSVGGVTGVEDNITLQA